jgi:hypothetical protein
MRLLISTVTGTLTTLLVDLKRTQMKLASEPRECGAKNRMSLNLSNIDLLESRQSSVRSFRFRFGSKPDNDTLKTLCPLFVPQPDVSNRSNPLEAKGSKIRIPQFNGGIVGIDTAPPQISGATRSRLSHQ